MEVNIQIKVNDNQTINLSMKEAEELFSILKKMFDNQSIPSWLISHSPTLGTVTNNSLKEEYKQWLNDVSELKVQTPFIKRY